MRPDGNERTVCIRAVYVDPALDERAGKGHLLFVICHDLTDLKERIELAKDKQLIATLQHEAKNGHQAQELNAGAALGHLEQLEGDYQQEQQDLHRNLRLGNVGPWSHDQVEG